MNKTYQKLIKSLHQKKNRIAENLFLVEGTKSVSELLQTYTNKNTATNSANNFVNSFVNNFVIRALFYTESFYEIHANKLSVNPAYSAIYQAITSQEVLEQSGTLQSNDGAIAVVEIPIDPTNFGTQNYVLALDDIRDPGNLGAMIRIADWYGIKQIICSQTTVDWYNPKVIIASMGSFLRVTPYYCDLENYLENYAITHTKPAIYGMFLEGENLHTTQFAAQGIIIVGNESNGISSKIANYVSKKITIQRFGEAESLNAAMATAIVFDNLRRYLTLEI